MVKGYGKKCENRDCKNEAQHIHHKDKNHNNNDSSNLRCLCASCHRKEHLDDNPDYEDSAMFRSRDLVDELQPHKAGYRLTAGFNALKENAHSNYD